MTARARSFGLVALSCLLAAACSSGGKSTTSTTTPPTTEPGVTTPDTTTPATTPGTTTPPRPPEFRSDGDEEDGWYWLRDDDRTATAEWTVFDLPPEPSDISLEMVARATDAAGTGGLDAAFVLSYGTGGGDEFAALADVAVTLPNTAHPKDPDGYTAKGRVVLDRTTIPAGTTELVVRTGRTYTDAEGTDVEGTDAEGSAVPPPPELTMLVAFRADSLRLGATPLAVSQVNPDIYQAGEFSSDGDYIEGWWWLRDDANQATATWNYQAIPSGDFDLQIDFQVLATDRTDGPGGFDARFYVSYGPIPDTRPLAEIPSVLVTLDNTGYDDDPLGYTSTGRYVIPRASLPVGTDEIWMKMSRVDANGENPVGLHLAFQQASVTMNEGPTTGDGDSADDAVVVGDGLHEGTLDGDDTVDWYTFPVDPKDHIIAFAVPPTGGAVSVTLYDPDRAEKATAIPSANGVVAHHIAADDAGGYWFVKVARVSGDGTYTVWVDTPRQNDGGAGGDAGDVPDTAPALTAGSYTGSASGRVGPDDPADYYRLTLDPGQRVEMTLTNPTPADAWYGSAVVLAEVRRLDDSLVYGAPSVNGVVTLETGNSGTAAGSFVLRVALQSGRGAVYDLDVQVTGTSTCDGFTAEARTFQTSAPSSVGWYWLDDGPENDNLNLLTATWTFGVMPPGPDDLRFVVDLPIRHPFNVMAGDPEGSFYALYGPISAASAPGIHGPVHVLLETRTFPGSITGFSGSAEFTLPRADLSGATEGFWVRIYRVDPRLGEDGLRTVPARTVLGVAASALRLCLGTTSDTSLPTLALPSPDPAATVSLTTDTHVLTSSTSIFVDPGSDLDGDGLNQNWETAAIDATNPLVEVDEEEIWLDDRASDHVANFVRVYPWPSILDPQYIVLSYITAWSKDYGGGPQGPIEGFERHDGDSERILQAWKVLDDTRVQLEWVMTSAHHSVTEHSGVWHATDHQCNVANIANQDHDWIGTEMMCNWLEYEADGRVKVYAARNKHGTYPGNSLCNSVRLANVYGTWWGENCGWEPSEWEWDSSDFNGESGYEGGGRWIWPAFNVGEPDNYLVDDLGNSSSWRGLTPDQGLELVGAFPGEHVWTGWHSTMHDFCGGQADGAATANDRSMPCSSRLGSKLEVTPDMALEKLRARYRVSVHTGLTVATFWMSPVRIFIWVRDSSGTQVLAGFLVGRFGVDQTEHFYLEAHSYLSDSSLGAPPASITLALTSGPTGVHWAVVSVTVTDRVTGATIDFPLDEILEVGETVEAP